MKYNLNYNNPGANLIKPKVYLRKYFEKTNNIQMFYKMEGKHLTLLRGNKFLFKNLNFTVSNGCLLLLQGINGSGKSSLLRILAGFIKPTYGSIVHTKNQNIVKHINVMEQNSESHYISHIDPIKTLLTVFQNIVFWFQIYQIKHFTLFTIFESLRLLQINELKFFKANILSMGQRRRLSLARLLIIANPFWLLDEPTAALDTKFIPIFSDLLQEHRNCGGVVILSTHMNLLVEHATSLRLNNKYL